MAVLVGQQNSKDKKKVPTVTEESRVKGESEGRATGEVGSSDP